MYSRARGGHAPPDEGGAHQGAPRQTKEESLRLHRRDNTAVDNLVNGDCRAEEPDVLWLTDTTEFATVDGKACLSPMVDLPASGLGLGIGHARGRSGYAWRRQASFPKAGGRLQLWVRTKGRAGPGPRRRPECARGGRERESALRPPVIMCLTSGLGAAAPSVLGVQPNSYGLAVLPPTSCMATAGASLPAISWYPWHRLRRALCARRPSAPQTGHWGGAGHCAPPRLRAL